MADKHGEALCRLMDGELSETETRFLLSRLGHDSELNARWQRYHLARSAVRGDLKPNLNGFAARVAQALDGEAPGRRSIALNRVGWLKPVGGLAVAASVALIVFNVWRQPPIESEPPLPEVNALAGTSSVERGFVPVATRASAGQSAPLRWDPRLQDYLIRHSEVSAPRRGQGLVPPYWYLVSEPVTVVVSEPEPEAAPQTAED